MPADHGLWFHDDEDVGPAGPQVAEGCPEESIERVQGRPRPLALEDRDLLPEGKDFESSVAPSTDEDAEGGQD